jgi:hypothetical protein
MNYKTLTIAFMISCLGGSLFAEQESVKVETNTDLYPEKTARWVTSWDDPKTSKKYAFSTSFMQVKPQHREIKKHKQKGTVPYRITGELIQLKESRGRTLRKRESGSVVIVVRDVDGKELLSKTISLAKFCPS